MACSPTINQVNFLQGIIDFWVGQATDTGMGRKLQHALQIAEEIRYEGALEELRTMCIL